MVHRGIISADIHCSERSKQIQVTYSRKFLWHVTYKHECMRTYGSEDKAGSTWSDSYHGAIIGWFLVPELGFASVDIHTHIIFRIHCPDSERRNVRLTSSVVHYPMAYDYLKCSSTDLIQVQKLMMTHMRLEYRYVSLQRLPTWWKWWKGKSCKCMTTHIHLHFMHALAPCRPQWLDPLTQSHSPAGTGMWIGAHLHTKQFSISVALWNFWTLALVFHTIDCHVSKLQTRLHVQNSQFHGSEELHSRRAS